MKRGEWVSEDRITWIESDGEDVLNNDDNHNDAEKEAEDEDVNADQIEECATAIQSVKRPIKQSPKAPAQSKQSPKPSKLAAVLKVGKSPKAKPAKSQSKVSTPELAPVLVLPNSISFTSPVRESAQTVSHARPKQSNVQNSDSPQVDVPQSPTKRANQTPVVTPKSQKVKFLLAGVEPTELFLPTPARKSIKQPITQPAKTSRTPKKRKSVEIEHVTESEPVVKRGRGRPRKNPLPLPEAIEEEEEDDDEEEEEQHPVEHLRYGDWEFSSLYFSPYPYEYRTATLYTCDRCLKYTRVAQKMYDHRLNRCRHIHPPGHRIYHDEQLGLSVYEVDGGANPTSQLYAQNLCLLGKCFIDTKTVYYHVKPFLFYVLTLTDTIQLPVVDEDDQLMHDIADHASNPPMPQPNSIKCDTMIGYFSKDKILYKEENQNLACLLTLPHKQGRGFGRFLVALSFELTRRQSLTGKPESPLSESARVTYQAYWRETLTDAIIKACQPSKRSSVTFCTLHNLAAVTGIDRADVIATISTLGFSTQTNENDEVGIAITSHACEQLVQHSNELKLKRAKRCQNSKQIQPVEFHPHLLTWPMLPTGGKVARSRSHTPISSPNMRLPFAPHTRASSPRPTLEQVDEVSDAPFTFMVEPPTEQHGVTSNSPSPLN